LIAPILLVALAENLGWRSTFFIVGIPGLILAFINWNFVKIVQQKVHIRKKTKVCLSEKSCNSKISKLLFY